MTRLDFLLEHSLLFLQGGESTLDRCGFETFRDGIDELGNFGPDLIFAGIAEHAALHEPQKTLPVRRCFGRRSSQNFGFTDFSSKSLCKLKEHQWIHELVAQSVRHQFLNSRAFDAFLVWACSHFLRCGAREIIFAGIAERAAARAAKDP